MRVNLTAAKVGLAVVKGYEHNHCRRWIHRPGSNRNRSVRRTHRASPLHAGHKECHHVGPSDRADPIWFAGCPIQPPAVDRSLSWANYAMHYLGASRGIRLISCALW